MSTVLLTQHVDLAQAFAWARAAAASCSGRGSRERITRQLVHVDWSVCESTWHGPGIK